MTTSSAVFLAHLESFEQLKVQESVSSWKVEERSYKTHAMTGYLLRASVMVLWVRLLFVMPTHVQVPDVLLPVQLSAKMP